MRKIARGVCALTVLLLTPTTPSEAAAVRFGGTVPAIVANTRGSAVAYDPINRVYLVVSANGVVNGRFVSSTGTPIGSSFPIQTHPGNFGAYPRVAFSPDANGGAGGFLVTWAEVDMIPVNASLHGRMVAYGQSGAYGDDRQLTAEGTWWEAGSYIAYSTGSDEFLVVYRMVGTYIIRGLRVGNDGAAKDVVFSISATSKFEDNPSVAYNPVTNQFLVSWKGFSDAGHFAFVDCRFVQAGANQLLGSPIRLHVTAATYITDTTYNSTTNEFLVSWDAGVGTGTQGRIVKADGSLPGGVYPISTRYYAYDALGVGYNPLTHTFFMVSHDAMGSPEDGGVELTEAGVPIDNGFLVTAAGGSGNFYPTIAASSDDPNWLVTTAASFKNASVQLVAGTSTNPQANPNPQMSLDTPGNGALQQPFLVAGWAADLGAASGVGIDTVHVWAWPIAGGAPTFVGAVAPSWARPDVGAAFGPRFATSGWGLSVSGLAPGTYVLAAYGHSTVANAFNIQRSVTVTISEPLMSLDLPGPNAIVPGAAFLVGGWAIDRGAASSAGVDAVHVWAVPVLGGSPVFLGGAAYGTPRPDVGAAFGAQFTNSGYNLVVTGLQPGGWYIVAYSHSAITGTFNAAQVVRVTVQ